MNFYVPTIGDSLYLSTPWTFTLHRERRNEALAKRLTSTGSVQEHERRYQEFECIKTYQREGYFGRIFQGHKWSVLQTDEKYLELLVDKEHWRFNREDIHRWKSFQWNESEAEVTLPPKTQLIVDRIYIKSTYRNFDSITFRIGKSPENKKLSKARFWVKLADANKIKCELYPIVDVEAAKNFAEDRFLSLEE